MTTSKYQKFPWRPLFWEPVEGTGERLMVGVIYKFYDKWNAKRIMRDDVLDHLYGKSSGDAKSLIDFSLNTFLEIAKSTDNIMSFDYPILGVTAGEFMETPAESEPSLLRIAALMYSSLASIESIDDEDEPTAQRQNDGIKRFTASIRNLVAEKRPNLANCFNQEFPLGNSGNTVKFGFHHQGRLIHFSLIRPQYLNSDIRMTRAKLWELAMAQNTNNKIIRSTNLITAIPRNDDPLISDDRLKRIVAVTDGFLNEARSENIAFHSAHSAADASAFVIELAH